MAKPIFTKGDNLPDLKASDLQEQANRVWRNSNLLPGDGIDIVETPFARTVQLADQFNRITTQNDLRFWSVVIETTANVVKVRQVDFRVLPASAGPLDEGQPGQIRAEEYRFRGPVIEALPNFGTKVKAYDAFVWVPSDTEDPRPTVDDTFLQVRWEGAYWVVEPPPAAAIQLRVVVLETDRLVCVSFADGVEGETQIHVALPWWLRTNPHDGSIRNGLEYAYESPSLRMVTREDDARIQEESIVPSYTPGDIIYVLGVDHTDVLDPDDSELSLIDMNVDGRVWAEI